MAAISLISIIWKNFLLPTPPQSLGLWFSEGWRKQNISVSHYEKLKSGCHFFNIDRMETFPITNPPPECGSLVFWVSTEMEYQHRPLWKNWKMAAISLISIVQKNFQLPTPPKFGSPVFRVLTETEYQRLSLWKNWKMAAISLISIIWKNFQLLTPPKFGSPVFQGLTETEYQHQPLRKNWNFLFSEFSIGSFSPITHPRLHFNIYAWLHLIHLCMDIYAWFTSHLCVVFHFLIFIVFNENLNL